MTTIDVEDICESIFENTSYRVIVRQVVVLSEIPALIEMDSSVISGEYMQVDGLTVVLSCRRDVLLQTVQQQGAWWKECFISERRFKSLNAHYGSMNFKLNDSVDCICFNDNNRNNAYNLLLVSHFTSSAH